MSRETKPEAAVDRLPVSRAERRLLLAAVLFGVLGTVAETVAMVSIGYLALARLPQSSLVLVAAVGVGVALGAASLLRAAADASIARAQARLEARLRGELMDAIMSAPWERLTSIPGHEIQSALLAEAPQVAVLTVGRFRIYSALASAAVGLAAAALISPAAAALACVAAVFVSLFYRRGTRDLLHAQRRLVETNSEMTRASSQMVSGMKATLLSPVRDLWRDRQEALTNQMRAARWESLWIPIRARTITEITAAVFVATVLVFELLAAGSVAPALVVLGLMLRLIPRAQSVQSESASVRHGKPWTTRWTSRLQLLTVPARSVKMPAGDAVASDASRGALSSSPRQVALELRDVSFSYEGSSKPTLDGVSLSISRGEWVGLVGESGGGKTTLIDCVAGLLRPQSGVVLLNGHESQDIAVAERMRQLAIVTQDVSLMGSSLDDIIAWDGLLKSHMSSTELRRAFGLDQMFKFGAQDVLDELGRDLSGGMRTRLAIARAVGVGPSVVILDETTSRLDPEAEELVLQAVRELLPSAAVLLTTHRDSSLAHVDRVLAIAGGRLVEGTRSVSESLRSDR